MSFNISFWGGLSLNERENPREEEILSSPERMDKKTLSKALEELLPTSVASGEFDGSA